MLKKMKVDGMGCSAMYWNGMLARTVDRVGELREHRIVGRKTYAGGAIGDIWIDGVNREGLMIALLNYRRELPADTSADSPADSLTDIQADLPERRTKVHPGALIPMLLEACGDVKSAVKMCETITLTADEPEMYVHYILADPSGACAVFENHRIYEKNAQILTNAPSLEEQLALLDQSEIRWDASSESRFARLAWLRKHAEMPEDADGMFALLDTVAVPRGMDARAGYRTMMKVVMGAGVYACVTEAYRRTAVQVGEMGMFSLG